jgi:uncharacterized membrane protein YbhN (UPF0104 family)
MKDLERLIRRVSQMLGAKRRRKLERLAGTVLLVASLAFLALVLGRGWREFRPYLEQVDLRLLGLAELCTLAALLLGALMWGTIQHAMGLGFTPTEAGVVHLLSAVTKYVPGYAWQYMSKAYLSRQRGASSRSILLAMLTELVLLLVGGLGIAASWALLSRLRGPVFEPLPRWIWPGVFVLALALAMGWNSMLARMTGGPVEQPGLWIALGAAVLGWMAYGLAAWLIGRSLYAVPWSAFPQHVVALVISGIAGLAIVFVPGGLGVREIVLAVLLVGILPFEVGVAASIVVRLSIVVAELLAFGIAFLLKGRPLLAAIWAVTRKD